MPSESGKQTVDHVITILGFLAATVGTAFALRGQILADLKEHVTTELKHVVTREELSDIRRQDSATGTARHLVILERLNSLNSEIREIRVIIQRRN